MNALEIKIARIRAGLRQYQLTAKVSITQSKLSEIECGRRYAPPELIARIFETIEEAHSAKAC
jgi:transcriptional regulator with XRE-family HTH domain